MAEAPRQAARLTPTGNRGRHLYFGSSATHHAYMRKGDKVVATGNIGGMMREPVPKGSKGVVVERGGWGSRHQVAFTVRGFLGDEKIVTIEVDDHEVVEIQ